eukprot:530440-Lingulodinium_polyedra.AAC.1
MFRTGPRSEVVDRLPAEGWHLADQDLQQLRTVSQHMWSAWGQTRLAERGNKEIREQATFWTQQTKSWFWPSNGTPCAPGKSLLSSEGLSWSQSPWKERLPSHLQDSPRPSSPPPPTPAPWT